MPYDFETLYCKGEAGRKKSRRIILKLRARLGNLCIANREGNGAIIRVKRRRKIVKEVFLIKRER
jgi:hypothetical protein